MSSRGAAWVAISLRWSVRIPFPGITIYGRRRKLSTYDIGLTPTPSFVPFFVGHLDPETAAHACTYSKYLCPRSFGSPSMAMQLSRVNYHCLSASFCRIPRSFLWTLIPWRHTLVCHAIGMYTRFLRFQLKNISCHTGTSNRGFCWRPKWPILRQYKMSKTSKCFDLIATSNELRL